MPKHNIPVYAIVELLMRLSHCNKHIGDYRGHSVRGDNVLVKTSGGSISFSQALIMQQFSAPESISNDQLTKTALPFRPTPGVKQTIL